MSKFYIGVILCSTLVIAIHFTGVKSFDLDGKSHGSSTLKSNIKYEVITRAEQI